MEVRRATVADARSIAEIHVRAWQVAYDHLFPRAELARLSIDERAARWARNLADHPVFVADDDGRIVGWASAGPSRDHRGHGELYAIYVSPESWGRGAGQALLGEVERELGGSYADATLWVLDDNPRARRFYERAGWQLDGGRKRDTFLGVAVEEVRYRKRLRPPRVLFVCVHNAGRSQIAAALLQRYGDGAIDVRSAGSEPAERLHPAVVEVMRERDIDLSRELPKRLSDDGVREADVVITMGCGDACPVYPGKRYEDWQLDDPAGKELEAVRRICDGIDARVRRLVAQLGE